MHIFVVQWEKAFAVPPALPMVQSQEGKKWLIAVSLLSPSNTHTITLKPEPIRGLV